MNLFLKKDTFGKILSPTKKTLYPQIVKRGLLFGPKHNVLKVELILSINIINGSTIFKILL